MTHPVGYYTGYDPEAKSPEVLHNLQERFGSRLQQMTYEQKIVFRAALADYIANKPVWQEEGNSISCIDCSIETAGVNWGIWDEDPELVQYIQACSELSEGNIEGLIEALTAQIQGRAYASRLEEWVVVSPN
ncbi:hypothetical protein NDI49_26015 [Trichocoleus sp. ST-U3]